MRIYVASLTDYNSGILHGKWIDVTDAESVMEEIKEMLAESPAAKKYGETAEEWAIHDYEYDYGIDLHLGEYEQIEKICEIAEKIESFDKERSKAFCHWLSYEDRDNDFDEFEDSYIGHFNSLAEFAEGRWEEWLEEEDKHIGRDCWWHPIKYIDWQKMGEDLEYAGEIWTIEDASDVYVFSRG